MQDYRSLPSSLDLFNIQSFSSSLSSLSTECSGANLFNTQISSCLLLNYIMTLRRVCDFCTNGMFAFG